MRSSIFRWRSRVNPFSPPLDLPPPATVPNDLNNSADIRALIRAMGERARKASRALAKASTAAKNQALETAADELVAREKTLLAANAQDVKSARAEGRDDAFIDRLK